MSYRNSTNKMIQTLKKFHVLILQHFDVDELTQFTEVDTNINKEVSNCPHCMCRIAVHFTMEKKSKFGELESIIKSKRKYRNIKLSCGNQEEFSNLFLQIIPAFHHALVRIDAFGVFLTKTDYNLELPNLKFIKVSFSNLNALKVFMSSTEKFQEIYIENFNEPIAERSYIDQMMRFRKVHLVNMEHVDMKVIKNLDFLYSNCINFQFESNRKSDFKSLAKLLEVLQCKEIQIKWIKPGFEGYRLTIRRIKRLDQISVPIIDLVHRRKRRKLKNERYADTEFLPSEYFSVVLEISELSWSFMKQIGSVLRNLETLKIFELSEREKRNFFITFVSLQKTIVGADEEDSKKNSGKITERASVDLRYARFDPLFRISTENLEFVFQHFTIDDFQNSSQVSGTWNNIVSKSKKYMEMLKLTLVKIKPKDVDDILHSLKHFQNIEISCNFVKSIVPHVTNLINFYSNFIVELFIHEVEAKRFGPFFMPNLKVLTLHTVSDSFCGSFLDTFTTLTSLKIQNVTFSDSYFYRIRNQRNIEKLFLVDIDCNRVKFPDPRIELNLEKIKHLEISYYLCKNYKEIDNDLFMERFIKDPCFEKLESITLCRIRGSTIDRTFKHCKDLRKIEWKNFHERDSRELYHIDNVVELYVQNFQYLESFEWKVYFPNYTTIYVGIPMENLNKRVDDSYRNFLKCMGTSGKKMIRNNTFSVASTEIASTDPLYQISPDLHDMVFQHLNWVDALNAIEVSRSWDAMCKDSRVLMDKFRLRLSAVDQYSERSVVKRLSKNHQNAFAFTSGFGYAYKVFENLRDLTVICNVKLSDSAKDMKFEFPNLEVLTINKQYRRSGHRIEVMNCLSFFTLCKKLKYLTIHEPLESQSTSDFFKIMRNNKDLKELKVYLINAVVNYFEADWTSGIECKLQKLTLGIYDNDIYRSKTIDDRLTKFLKLHSNTCEELMLSYCSNPMFREVFRNYKKIHTFFAAHGFRKEDDEDLPINLTIVNAVIPYGMPSAHMPFLIERLPNLHKLFVSKFDAEVAQCCANNLPFLTHLSYYTEHENGIRRYNQMTVNSSKKNVKFIRLENIKFQEISLDAIFTEDSPFKWVDRPPRRIGFGVGLGSDDDYDEYMEERSRD